MGPGRTAAASSRLLYDIIGAVYDRLGFGVVDDPVFRDLVIARISRRIPRVDGERTCARASPTVNRHRTARAEQAGGAHASLSGACRYCRRGHRRSYRAAIEQFN